MTLIEILAKRKQAAQQAVEAPADTETKGDTQEPNYTYGQPTSNPWFEGCTDF